MQEEAAMFASMASNAIFLLNHEQNRIAVTIQADLFDLLNMSRLFAFMPKFLT
jgi:hypothetical protein